MIYIKENSTVPILSILYLGKMASGLLSTLEPYVNNKKINFLKDKDKKNIEDAVKLLDNVIRGCESEDDLRKLFQCDKNFPVTPASALELAVEIITQKINYPKNIQEVKERCNSYLKIIKNFEKGEEINDKDKLNETILFFDGIEKKLKSEMYKKIYLFNSYL